MTTFTIGKQLNKLFEEVYSLFDNAIMIPKYLNLNNPNIENEIINFMNTVKVKSEWNMNNKERKGLNSLYFESGHNGVNAIYYPFDNELNNISGLLFTVNNLLEVWEDALDCIIDYCEEKEYVNIAEELKVKLKNII